MANRLLVTGASGFIGCAFARAAPSGVEIVALSSPQHQAAGELALDLCDKDSLRAVLRDFRPTHVLNFASRGTSRGSSTFSEMLAVNTIGALNILEALSEEGLSSHVFMFGTAYEYAHDSRGLNESARLNPQSLYAISKTALYYALKYYAAVGPLTFLRVFNIFGIGEPADRLLPFVVSKARAGEEIPLTLGKQQRDFMFVDDLVAILHRLINIPALATSGLTTINIGTGKGTSLTTFIGYITEALQQCGLSPKLNFGALPYSANESMSLVADNNRLQELLGDYSFADLQGAVDLTVRALCER